jgi:hypothetical protein
VAGERFQFFPYREEDVLTSAGGPAAILRPTVDITLSRGDLESTVTALIDTGAPFTLFARGVGDLLGVPFDDGTAAPIRSHHIGGARREAQLDHVDLSLAAFDGLAWQAEVEFFLDDWRLPFAGSSGTPGSSTDGSSRSTTA